MRHNKGPPPSKRKRHLEPVFWPSNVVALLVIAQSRKDQRQWYARRSVQQHSFDEVRGARLFLSAGKSRQIHSAAAASRRESLFPHRRVGLGRLGARLHGEIVPQKNDFRAPLKKGRKFGGPVLVSSVPNRTRSGQLLVLHSRACVSANAPRAVYTCVGATRARRRATLLSVCAGLLPSRELFLLSDQTHASSAIAEPGSDGTLRRGRRAEEKAEGKRRTDRDCALAGESASPRRAISDEG